MLGDHGVTGSTVVALLARTSACALGRHGRRLKLGTILLEGDEFSWHAFWQVAGPAGSRLLDNGLGDGDQSRRSGRGTAKCQRREVHEGTPRCVGCDPRRQDGWIGLVFRWMVEVDGRWRTRAVLKEEEQRRAGSGQTKLGRGEMAS